MLNKKKSPGLVAGGVLWAICALSIFFEGCASKPRAEELAPLWVSYDTIEEVYPSDAYIARIGRGADGALSASLAESELGSYFSHTVHSVVQGSQVMTDSKRGTAEGAGNAKQASVSRSIERTVTVESLNRLFDVRKTAPWYDRSKKEYVCCAYIKRADAWKIYEGSVKAAAEKFHTFYDSASAERDHLRKISLLKNCDQAAEDFLESLEMARLILPGKEAAFAADRRLAEGLELEREAALTNCVMFVSASNDEGGRLTRCVSQTVSDCGFVLAQKSADALYFIQLELDYGKNLYGDTLTADPGISVVIQSRFGTGGAAATGKTVFTYKKNLPHQTGFTAAEALVNRKILTSAEAELKASFEEEFRKSFIDML